MSVLGDEDAVWNSDETGFPKKGTKSVGVKRQYSGTLGRTDNCQIAVFANYSSAKGHTFMDRRLFLPEEWADDHDRRSEAGVPAGVIFRTKPELALEMVANAMARTDAVSLGRRRQYLRQQPHLRAGLRELGKWYVLDISSEAHVWTEEPQVIPPEQRPKPSRGRPHTQPLVIGESQPVSEVVAALPAKCLAPRHRGGREPGTTSLRIRGDMGLVQRRGTAGSSGTLARTTIAGPRARAEISPSYAAGRCAAD